MKIFSALLIACSLAGFLHADAYIGNHAPDFTRQDINGITCTLSQYEGKLVVIEWTNPECPFVKKHYSKKTNNGVGNLQAMQKKYTSQGVIWITIDSSGPGKQGYLTEADWKTKLTELGSTPTHLIIDATGELALMYGARKTPELFLIGKDGHLLYKGAIDSIPGTDPEEIESPVNINFFTHAIENALQGRAVVTQITIPYGCSIKFASS